MAMPTWLTPALIVAVLALFTGGLGGSVLTAWLNSRPALSLGYVVTTTTTGTENARSLVPGLELRIGDRNLPAIHTHVVTLSGTDGYADVVDVAVSFSGKIEILGQDFDSPSPLHRIACDTIEVGVTCKLQPVDNQGSYKISLATDAQETPRVTAIGNGVELEPLQDLAANREELAGLVWTSVTNIGAIILGLIATILAYRQMRAGQR